MNVAVIGNGAFGKWHVKLLAADSRVEELVATRTTEERARESTAGYNGRVQPFAVANAADMEQLLTEFNPDLVDITAKSMSNSHDIHTEYAALALQHGARVFFEKPAHTATGDGTSVRHVDDLLAYRDGVIGMHLPLSAIHQERYQDTPFMSALHSAAEIAYDWNSTGEGDVIDDLLLHPWSTLPNGIVRGDVQAKKHDTGYEIAFTTTSSVAVRIRLGRGNDTRTVTLDGQCYHVVKGADNVNSFVPVTNGTLGASALDVENPLQQHISAMFATPLFGGDGIRQSQTFLEKAQYKVNELEGKKARETGGYSLGL
ncbi:MAG: Gfo/Idh/MocA family oxidoreductase [Candidatus Woesearchaeota archaeon]|nr:Gfo/Idh/MocA family oxidoreductase [Candidatus Woesearchaeota archaeon]